jgi:hypothetical protein
MHDMQTVAVLVMCALEFEYQLALGLGNSDSSSTMSTLAQEVMRTHLCARKLWTSLSVRRDRGRQLSQCVRIACTILLGA